MADLRYDPVSGTWVAIASKRRERPIEFVPIEQLNQQIICPFCSGNEDETPAAISAYRHDGTLLSETNDQTEWVSRIIPNKYPSLSDSHSELDFGPYDGSSTDGIQELVIPTPRHVTSISELKLTEMALCWRACQERIVSLRTIPAIEHLMLFMNCRSAAGATLEHIHFQIMGSPILSTRMMERTARNEMNQATRGESLIATLLAWELQQSIRVIKETKQFVMLCPFASRFSFQVWIVPKDAKLLFSDVSNEVNGELAQLCIKYVRKLEELLDKPAYNLVVNLEPTRQRKHEHWFVEIFPRLNRMAGYEIGTDIWVNPVSPETAARRLSG